jgi:hypothetical protein
MQITHRAPADAPALSTRLSCCCRISELLPLMRQAHDAARAARQATEAAPAEAA